ncbi:MAG: ribulose-phosphate 3-epimerase [Mycoplasmatales bacterium]
MKIAPSILSADFMNLEQEIQRINNTDVEWIHLDVMDGNFVQNITFGLSLIKRISEMTNKSLDVHLMVKHPQNLVEQLCELNISYITIHIEILQNVDFVYLKNICQKKNITLGLAINPDTKIEDYKEYLNKINYILLMSVEPGKSGQSFKPEVLDKVKEIRKLENGKNIIINIDGGINQDTIKQIKQTTIDVVVSGVYLFDGDMQQNINKLRISK